MFKYINYHIFIIFGIILFILLNNRDYFSVGDQFIMAEDPRGNSDFLLKIFNEIKVNELDPCTLFGLTSCVRCIREVHGGSCSIYGIIGFFYLLGLDLTDTNLQDYINSFGADFTEYHNMPEIYKCLVKNQGMLHRLQGQGFDPDSLQTTKIGQINDNIINLVLNTLYIMYYTYNPDTYTGWHMQNLSREDVYEDIKKVVEPHMFLFYKINIDSFQRFCNDLEGMQLSNEHLANNIRKIIAKKDKILHRGYNDNTFVIVIIDYSNTIFKIITDDNYPITLYNSELETHRAQSSSTMLEDEDPADYLIRRQLIKEYNQKWKLKIYWFWLLRFRNNMPMDFDINQLINTEDRDMIINLNPIKQDIQQDIEIQSDNLESFNNIILQNVNFYVYTMDTLNDQPLDITECNEIRMFRDGLNKPCLEDKTCNGSFVCQMIRGRGDICTENGQIDKQCISHIIDYYDVNMTWNSWKLAALNGTQNLKRVRYYDGVIYILRDGRYDVSAQEPYISIDPHRLESLSNIGTEMIGTRSYFYFKYMGIYYYFWATTPEELQNIQSIYSLIQSLIQSSTNSCAVGPVDELANYCNDNLYCDEGTCIDPFP